MAPGSKISLKFQALKKNFETYQGELGWVIAQAEADKEGAQSPARDTEERPRVENSYSQSMEYQMDPALAGSNYCLAGGEESGQITPPPMFNIQHVPTPGKNVIPISFAESMEKNEKDRREKEAHYQCVVETVVYA